jgi:hypothetical protein
MINQEATQEEIWSQQEKIWDIEVEILNLKKEENELDNEALNNAKELNRERNRLLMLMKQGEQIDPAQIKEIERQIIENLRAAGATDDQIQRQVQTFEATMTSFQHGGRTTGGLAMVHDNEMVIGQESTRKIDEIAPGLLDLMNTDPLKTLRELWSGYLASMGMLEQAKQINNNTTNLGGINVMVHINGGSNLDPQDVAKAVSNELERKFQGNGIQLGNL